MTLLRAVIHPASAPLHPLDPWQVAMETKAGLMVFFARGFDLFLNETKGVIDRHYCPELREKLGKIVVNPSGVYFLDSCGSVLVVLHVGACCGQAQSPRMRGRMQAISSLIQHYTGGGRVSLFDLLTGGSMTLTKTSKGWIALRSYSNGGENFRA